MGPAWVGDMVMAQVLYKALYADHTSAEIHVVAPKWSRPLLSRMAEISTVVSLDVSHGEFGLSKRIALGKKLRREDYAQAIILPRSFKSALVPWAARIPKRIGDIGEFRYGLLTHIFPSNKDKNIPTACNYLRYAGVETDIATVKKEYRPELSVDIDNQQKLLERFNIPKDVPLVACMVGAEYGPSKQWPVENFVFLIDMLREQGINVCLLGSSKDSDTGKRIETLCQSSIMNLCGETGLVDVIDILASCKVAVSNDSGLMHIAAAVNVPVVAMYGATTPLYTPPLHAKAKSLHVKLACSPCWERTCRYNHYRCLKDILPQDVCDIVLSKIQS